MAKSLRSKSQRKFRAILHAQVFKPVEDARTARLSAKLNSIPQSSSMESLSSATKDDATMSVDPKSYLAKTKKISIARQITESVRRPGKNNKRRDVKAVKELNLYGLSEREIRF